MDYGATYLGGRTGERAEFVEGDLRVRVLLGECDQAEGQEELVLDQVAVLLVVADVPHLARPAVR